MMNNKRKQFLVEQLQHFATTKGLSQADVKRELDIPERYLIEMFKGVFTYDNGRDIPLKHFSKIEDYLGLSKEKQIWKLVPTTQAEQILAILTDAKDYGYTNLIIGETGSGKTFLSDRFIQKSPKDSFKITVGSTDTIADLLDKILDVLKIPQGKSKSKKLNDIVKKLVQLKYEGYKPILIFDESEYMKQATLCNMKELHDHLSGKCGVVMIGTDQLLVKLDKLKKKNRDGIPQFYRRVKFNIRTLNGIDTSFKAFLNALNITDKSFIKFLQSNCENYGELHDALVPVLRESERTGEPLTENFARLVLNLPSYR
ncbi:ATP-binding protein [Myroides odoratimimus]|uniref:ATP-binding protein n=1 Tax=Myroides odoratimimus TaxID=76832 RepID=UPI00257613F0|nr:ATP-binding protein [Myroides odoratimimus]MDM1093394.1 ATP-binding protein [Myroides odoratimimus]